MLRAAVPAKNFDFLASASYKLIDWQKWMYLDYKAYVV